MALKKCPKCGQTFDWGTKTCPDCGTATKMNPHSKKGLKGCLTILLGPVIILLIIWLYVILFGSPGPGSVEHKEDYIAGKYAMQSGDYDKAVELFTKIIESDYVTPEYLTLSYYSRGSALLQKGDYDKAIYNLSLALNLFPEHIGSLNARSSAYMKTGRFDKAIADMKRITELSPKKIYHDRLIHLQKSMNPNNSKTPSAE